MSLSDDIINTATRDGRNTYEILEVEDVREAVRELKKISFTGNDFADERIIKEINKIFGEKLI